MQSPPQNVESTFSRSWDLLMKNGIIIVPGLVIGFVVGVIDYFLAPHTEYVAGYGVTTWWAAAIGSVLLILVNLAGFILAQCYMTGMAGAAWQRGTTDLSDGTRAFERDASNVFIALIGLFVALVIAAILALPTLGISALLYFYFFIYTFPAAIIGERPGLRRDGRFVSDRRTSRRTDADRHDHDRGHHLHRPHDRRRTALHPADRPDRRPRSSSNWFWPTLRSSSSANIWPSGTASGSPPLRLDAQGGPAQAGKRNEQEFDSV